MVRVNIQAVVRQCGPPRIKLHIPDFLPENAISINRHRYHGEQEQRKDRLVTVQGLPVPESLARPSFKSQKNSTKIEQESPLELKYEISRGRYETKIMNDLLGFYARDRGSLSLPTWHISSVSLSRDLRTCTVSWDLSTEDTGSLMSKVQEMLERSKAAAKHYIARNNRFKFIPEFVFERINA